MIREADRAGKRLTDDWCDDRLEGLAPTTAHDEAVRHWWRRWCRVSASPTALSQLSRMNAEIDVRHVLPVVRVPTLVVHRVGDEDVVLDEGRYLAERIPGAAMAEVDGIDHGWWVNSEQIADVVQPFLEGLWRDDQWHGVEPDRVLATVLFTDIVGSTARLAELGDRRWRELLEEHHRFIRGQLARFNGREVDTAGDGFFATFDGPARAIRCATAITSGVRDLGLEVRAGLHTGECEVLDGKVGGIAVHIGARVAAQAGPGRGARVRNGEGPGGRVRHRVRSSAVWPSSRGCRERGASTPWSPRRPVEVSAGEPGTPSTSSPGRPARPGRAPVPRPS